LICRILLGAQVHGVKSKKFHLTPESTPAGFCDFWRGPEPEAKICVKPDPESLFIFGSSRSLHGLNKRQYLNKNIAKFCFSGFRTGVGSLNLKKILTCVVNPAYPALVTCLQVGHTNKCSCTWL